MFCFLILDKMEILFFQTKPTKQDLNNNLINKTNVKNNIHIWSSSLSCYSSLCNSKPQRASVQEITFSFPWCVRSESIRPQHVWLILTLESNRPAYQKSYYRNAGRQISQPILQCNPAILIQCCQQFHVKMMKKGLNRYKIPSLSCPELCLMDFGCVSIFVGSGSM